GRVEPPCRRPVERGRARAAPGPAFDGRGAEARRQPVGLERPRGRALPPAVVAALPLDRPRAGRLQRRSDRGRRGRRRTDAGDAGLRRQRDGTVARPARLPLALAVLALAACGGGAKPKTETSCPTTGAKVSFPLLD